jgi:D-alanine--poly(phosphoribitol) ligase subunit 2
MKEKIKRFLEDTFLFEFNDEITETSDLFKLGVIDSFGYIQLIRYLEREFNITFSEEDMLSDVLVSVSNIVDYMSQRVGSELL